jgi:hypothetical protein
MPKENNRQLGENSPNLVDLFSSARLQRGSGLKVTQKLAGPCVYKITLLFFIYILRQAIMSIMHELKLKLKSHACAGGWVGATGCQEKS